MKPRPRHGCRGGAADIPRTALLQVLGNATCTAGPESKDACAAWDPTPVFDADTGVVHVLVAAAASEQDRMTGTGTVWALKSSDLGATWSPPLNITDQLYFRRADSFL